MNGANMQSVLQQIRSLSAEAQGQPPDTAPTGGSFAELLGEFVAHVNSSQQRADQMRLDFQRGVPEADLPKVMVASEQASVAFQALTQTRNRLLEAYREIMNMSI